MTPFTPTDWKMTFDGETVSLRPSIGNWTLKCRSHYVIDRGSVIEASPWSMEEVAAERSRDRAAKARFFGQSQPVEPPVQSAPCKAAPSSWRRVWDRISSRSER